MKKIICLVLCLLLSLGLTACGDSRVPQQSGSSSASLTSSEESAEAMQYPEPEPIAPREGYAIFDSEYLSLQYPDRYTEWSWNTAEDQAVRDAVTSVVERATPRVILKPFWRDSLISKRPRPMSCATLPYG